MPPSRRERILTGDPPAGQCAFTGSSWFPAANHNLQLTGALGWGPMMPGGGTGRTRRVLQAVITSLAQLALELFGKLTRSACWLWPIEQRLSFHVRETHRPSDQRGRKGGARWLVIVV